jgi:tripartite-type tricarboxylate transporter receptor subunit TctC
MTIRRTLPALLLSIGLMGASAQIAAASSSYPDRSVRMVVPFPPGGSVDYIARIVMPAFAKELGQSVFIDNKGGASGSIGTADAARAKPDGYTLLMVFDTHAVNPHLYKSLPYDTFKSFDYVTLMTTAPMVLATTKTFAPESLPQLIDYAKQHPGAVSYGSSGVGGSNHLTALAFSKAANIDTLHVPYKGGGPMLTAVIGGQVNFVVTTYPLVVERIKAGQLKAIAMGSEKRVPQLPNTPTVSEFLPGYGANSWIGLAAPKGTPEPVLKKIHTAITNALNSPEVHGRLTSEGFDVVPGTPEAFETWVREKSNEAATLIRDGGISTE